MIMPFKTLSCIMLRVPKTRCYCDLFVVPYVENGGTIGFIFVFGVQLTIKNGGNVNLKQKGRNWKWKI